MRTELIVYIDTLGVGAATAVAEGAARLGVGTALVCPHGSGPQSSSPFIRIVETRNFSLPNLRKILATLDRSYKIRGIHSSFGPFRADGFLHGHVATLAMERGLPHSPVHALAAATNKFVGRSRLAAAGVPDVPFALATDEMSASNVARHIGYPVVLKPLTGVGSSLVFRCGDDREVRTNWRRAMKALPCAHYEQVRMTPHTFEIAPGAVMYFDPSRMMLVERYLRGREASVECMVVGHRVRALVVHDKLSVEEKSATVLEHLLVAPPVRFTTREVHKLRDHAVRAITAFGLQDVFCHVEMRWVDGLGPRVLEINPRIGAGCVTDSIETFTELDVDAVRAQLIMGAAPWRIRTRHAGRHAMIFLFAPRSGTLRRLEGLERIANLPRVRAVRFMREVEDRVGGDTEEGFLASVWTEVKDEKDAHRVYARIRALAQIRVR
jgi:biotin carboxylase